MFKYVCFDNDKSKGKLFFLQKSKKGIVVVEQTNLTILQSDVNLKRVQKILDDTNLFKGNLVFFDIEVLLYSCEIGLINDLVQLLTALSRLKKTVCLILSIDESTNERMEQYYHLILDKLKELNVSDNYEFILYEENKEFEEKIINKICKETGLKPSLFQEIVEEDEKVVEKYHLVHDKVKVLFYNINELTEKNRFASYISLTYPRLLRMLLGDSEKIAVNFLSLHKDDSLMEIKTNYSTQYNLVENKNAFMKGLSTLYNLEGDGIEYSFTNELNGGNRTANIVYDVVYGNEDVDLSQYNQIFIYIRNLEDVYKAQDWLVRKAQNFSARPAYFTTYFVLHYKRQDIAYSMYEILTEKFCKIKILVSNPMTGDEVFGSSKTTLNTKVQYNRIKEWEESFNHLITKEETHINKRTMNFDQVEAMKSKNKNGDSPAV